MLVVLGPAFLALVFLVWVVFVLLPFSLSSWSPSPAPNRNGSLSHGSPCLGTPEPFHLGPGPPGHPGLVRSIFLSLNVLVLVIFPIQALLLQVLVLLFHLVLQALVSLVLVLLALLALFLLLLVMILLVHLVLLALGLVLMALFLLVPFDHVPLVFLVLIMVILVPFPYWT